MLSSTVPASRPSQILQTVSMAVCLLLFAMSFLQQSLVARRYWGELFLGLLYCAVVVAVGSTWLRYRREQRIMLPRWRRVPYEIGLVLLVLLCLCPVATWYIASTGKYLGPHARPGPLFLSLFCTNMAAAILAWFGPGWPRLGLTVVSACILFLWAFPLGLGL